MAYCPKCQGEMQTMDTVCGKCGYDFPDDNPASNPFHQETSPTWPFTPVAGYVLIAAQVIAGLGCLLVAVGSVAAVFQGKGGMVFEGLLAAIMLAAMVIVIARVRQQNPPGSL